MNGEIEQTSVPGTAPERPRRSRRGGRALLDGWLVVIVAIAVVALASGGWVLGKGLLAKPRSARAVKASAALGTLAAPDPEPGPTAVFGHMELYGVKMHFPASAEDMVGIGFHQAWNTKATDMVPDLEVHPKDKYASTQAALKADRSLKLFLMMARGRGSSEYSAADCAVRPGAEILSPVTGKVTLVKTYPLSGYGTDYRVEIEADGASPVRVVLIHIKDVKVKAGMRVEGGVTPIAVVRHLGSISSQVNRYLPVPADHTHMQINAVGYKLNESS